MSDSPNISSGLEIIRKARNASPSDADFAQIGHIALNHSGLEFQLESLTWIYMGDVDIGHVATSQMTTLQTIKALETMVDWNEPDDAIAEEIEWCLKAFEILRINRNIIIHGYNFKADRKAGELFIERRTRSVVFDSFEQFEFTSKSLMTIIREQGQLADHLYHIQFHVDARSVKSLEPTPSGPSNPTILRPRPSLPTALKPLHRETPQSDRHQRQSSRQRAAKVERHQTKMHRGTKHESPS